MRWEAAPKPRLTDESYKPGYLQRVMTIEERLKLTADKDFVIKTIMETARSGGKGAFGDGKIFISDVEESYTISSGVKETAEAAEGVPA